MVWLRETKSAFGSLESKMWMRDAGKASCTILLAWYSAPLIPQSFPGEKHPYNGSLRMQVSLKRYS